jgi:hypothetical protein
LDGRVTAPAQEAPVVRLRRLPPIVARVAWRLGKVNIVAIQHGF